MNEIIAIGGEPGSGSWKPVRRLAEALRMEYYEENVLDKLSSGRY